MILDGGFHIELPTSRQATSGHMIEHWEALSTGKPTPSAGHRLRLALGSAVGAQNSGGLPWSQRTNLATSGWDRMASGVLNSWASSRSVHRLWIFLWQIRWTQSVLRPPSLLGTKWWRLTLGPGSIGRPQIGHGPSGAASATVLGALQDAFSQRLVVAVEVVAAPGLDPPGAVERGVEADGLVLVVLAVEALDLGAVE